MVALGEGGSVHIFYTARVVIHPPYQGQQIRGECLIKQQAFRAVCYEHETGRDSRVVIRV